MIVALVTGALYGAPQEKISKNGRAYVSATLKVRDREEAVSWVPITAFSPTAKLLRLGDGDAVTVQGPLKAELYTPAGGEPRVSRSLVVDEVLALRQPPKERSPKTVAKASDDYRSKEQRQRGSWTPGSGPNDSLDGLGF